MLIHVAVKCVYLCVALVQVNTFFFLFLSLPPGISNSLEFSGLDFFSFFLNIELEVIYFVQRIWGEVGFFSHIIIILPAIMSIFKICFILYLPFFLVAIVNTGLIKVDLFVTSFFYQYLCVR